MPHARLQAIGRPRASTLAVVAVAALTAACAGSPDAPPANPTPAPTVTPTTTPTLNASLAPTPLPSPTASAPTSTRAAEDLAVTAALARMDLDTRLGQLLTVRVYGGELHASDTRNRRTHGVDTPAEVIDTLRPGGIILFDREGRTSTGNLDDVDQARAFTDDLRRHAHRRTGAPVLVAVDREGGRVDRLARIGTTLPSAAEVGAHEHAPLVARAVAEVAALELKALGIDVNYAPVVDLAAPDQRGAIGDRSFQLDPRHSARLTAISIRGHLAHGVAPTVKHFPGHGATEIDSHQDLPTVTTEVEVLHDRELIPFRAALRAGVPIVMTGHLVVPALDPSHAPASMSAPMITGLLRERMGFEGVVVADALEMQGLRDAGPDVGVRAIEAGTDVLLLPVDAAATRDRLHDAIARGELTRARVDQSVQRILRLRYRLGLLDGAVERPDPQIVGSEGMRQRIERALRGEPTGTYGDDPTSRDEPPKPDLSPTGG